LALVKPQAAYSNALNDRLASFAIGSAAEAGAQRSGGIVNCETVPTLSLTAGGSKQGSNQLAQRKISTYMQHLPD
jgi:hypothetical protein